MIYVLIILIIFFILLVIHSYLVIDISRYTIKDKRIDKGESYVKSRIQKDIKKD